MLLGNPEVRGKGYGVDTIMAIMRFAFDELGLEHLDSDIIEYNKPSMRAYVEHCGWQVQGTKPKWYYRNGKRWDKILVGISNENYRDLVKNKEYWGQGK
jgi:RimJ/RimL family protein N-acetyltransferase